MKKIPELALKIIDLLEKGGAKDVLVVGGFARDLLLEKESKDVDIEVYGLSYAQIQNILSPYFRVDLVGQSFGVLKVANAVDVALPRRESKMGIGHKGFEVESVPDLTPQEAFARRDFTINAIGIRRDGSICDPCGGVDDVKRKVLRACSPAFKDDPLRVLRGMQFAARFGFSMDEQTIQYCKEVFNEFPTLSEERIYEEWKKWALKGVYPDLGLDVLLQTGWIKAFPELNALVGCPQNPQWHPEGDVWTHTRAVCREAFKTTQTFRPKLTEDERVVLMFAALCHDFGKPQTTKLDDDGVLRSIGHAEVGAPLALNFLDKMKAPKRISAAVANLVERHMATQDVKNAPSDRMIRRLAQRLDPATIKLWALLCQADALGCGVPERYEIDAVDSSVSSTETCDRTKRKIRFQSDVWLDAAKRLDLIESAPKPLLQGRDLLAFGLEPSPRFGAILKRAMEAQIEGEFTTKEDGVEWLRKTLANQSHS